MGKEWVRNEFGAGRRTALIKRETAAWHFCVSGGFAFVM
jgi:hypothetical protein